VIRRSVVVRGGGFDSCLRIALAVRSIAKVDVWSKEDDVIRLRVIDSPAGLWSAYLL
jgi:hypothetical protein